MSVLEHVDSPLYLGLMSGTSADGIDAALVRFADDTHRRCELVAGTTVAWEPQLRETWWRSARAPRRWPSMR